MRRCLRLLPLMAAALAVLALSAFGAVMPNMDVNKDALINSGDQLVMARFVPPGSCP